MKFLKLNSTDANNNDQVSLLQSKLNESKVCSVTLHVDGNFGHGTKAAVKEFQQHFGLAADGLVGFRTWSKLLFVNLDVTKGITEEVYQTVANLLDCEVAAVKAVKEVETGGLSALDSQNRPRILFEGHIFWNRLKKHGLNPESYKAKYPTIVYPNWDRSKYTKDEWKRLELARTINADAANESASFGMFQIMGMNYNKCDCATVTEFVHANYNEVSQFSLFVNFIYSCNLGRYLQSKDWTTFAKLYNGPGYAQNKYDQKLAKAYQKYK